jgi:hypothetical protein
MSRRYGEAVGRRIEATSWCVLIAFKLTAEETRSQGKSVISANRTELLATGW